LASVESARSVLEEPDPVAPVVDALCDALRASVSSKAEEFGSRRGQAIAQLDAAPDWQNLGTEERATILREVGLADAGSPSIASADELLQTLDAVPLPDWRFRIQAVGPQAGEALIRAARSHQPETVELPPTRVVVRDIKQLEAHLERVRAQAKRHLDEGKAVIL
jgi:hypothetical protein